MEQFTSATSQTRTTQIRLPAPIARFLMLVIIAVTAIISLIILIPLLIIALVLGLIFILYIKVKSLFTKAHKPNGPLDGRHNVKVISRDE